MLPGPRSSTGSARLDAGCGQEAELRLPVALTRSTGGWSVVSPAGVEHVAGLIEGLSLADLVAEEFGVCPDPDRSARRSVRGGGPAPDDAGAAVSDPTASRVAALERTVRQLEHALSARVATERAIGVLAERTGTAPREAFETLRREARASGRPVAEIAREVLETLAVGPNPRNDIAGAPVPAGRELLNRPGSDGGPAVAAADGRR